MELTERPDPRAVAYLASIPYVTFKVNCLIRAAKKGKKEPKEKDIQAKYTILEQFCKTNLKTKCITKRIYSYSINTPAGLGGRLFSTGSMQGISGMYRGLLMSGRGTDIDMVNAHPVILRYICSLHGIPCPALEYYVNHRDEVLSKWTDRAKGKTAYLIATNDEKPACFSKYETESEETNEALQGYIKESNKLKKKITALSEYAELIATVPTNKEYNLNGSGLNRVLCYYENIIVQHAVHVANIRGLEIAMIMFDGFMPYGDHYQETELLEEIQTYVESQMPGLNMQWSYKEHSDEIQIPADFDENAKSEQTSKPYVTSDLDAAQILYKAYPHWKYCKGQLYVFDDNMWTPDRVSHNKVVSRFTNILWVGQHNRKTGEMEASTTKSYGNTTTLGSLMLTKLETLCIDNDWIKRTERSSLGKLLFENGYLDLREGVFYNFEKNKPDPSIVFIYKIPHKWLPEEDGGEYRKDILKRIFTDPLGEEVGNYFCHQLSRGLAGDQMKRILFGLGYSNTGKSTISKALIRSCGEYVDTFNANNLAYKQTSQDQGQQNRWIMLKKDKRIILSNEINSMVTLNGNGIKSLSSGGDEIEGRTHGGNETTFSIQFLPVVFANDLPEIKPYDDALDKRINVVSYTKPYVENPGENELLADPNIDAEINTIEFQQAFVRVLVYQYHKGKTGRFDSVPSGVLNAKKDWIGTEVTCLNRFMQDYTITNEAHHFVRSNEIEDWLLSNKTGVSMKRFSMDMKQYATNNKLVNVIPVQKKYAGKATRMWSGIKFIREENDESETDGDETD